MEFREAFARTISSAVGIDKDKALLLLEEPPEPRLGDVAFPCFSLSKTMKKNPNDIALSILSKIADSRDHTPRRTEDLDFFERFEAIGGYVNGYYRRESLISKTLLEQIKPMKTVTKRIMVEYMNANPNKPLHIGQARNVCLGDSLIRMYKRQGHTVHAINYGDDSGVNVGYNIVGHLYYNMPFETNEKFDHYAGKAYTMMRGNEEDKLFKERLGEVLRKIEDADDIQFIELHKKYTRNVVIAQFESCWKIGAYFDLVNWETDILHLKFFENTIEKLKGQGLIEYIEEGDMKGCWVINLSKIDKYKGIKNPYQVLIKSDGIATYVAKDIVYAMWKLGYLGYDFYYEKLVSQPNNTIVYSTRSMPTDIKPDFGSYDTALQVIDNRQSHLQSVVSSALEMMGFTGNDKEYTHIDYGVVYLTPNTLEAFGFELSDEEKSNRKLPFSSRKGWFITLDDTYDLLVQKAYGESKKRNPDKDEEWLKETAKSIAISSLRFFLTRTDANKEIIFDIDEALDMEGETGAYALYTYARISSILKKSEHVEFVDSPHVELLTEDLEYEMVKKIRNYETVYHNALISNSPSMICRYIIELCQMFNSYYSKVPVLKAIGEVSYARLLLLKSVQETLSEAFSMVGLIGLERM
ncbi:MAG: arginine--tRNA ligase [Candidatus Woesearchaeota archaeon]